jgi:mRNA-degrading endonuclease RelE of RelBE toxin-antitoxin system
VIEKGNPAVRELVEGNYRIIYKIIDKEKIDILTVHHSARDLNRREIL